MSKQADHEREQAELKFKLKQAESEIKVKQGEINQANCEIVFGYGIDYTLVLGGGITGGHVGFVMMDLNTDHSDCAMATEKFASPEEAWQDMENWLATAGGAQKATLWTFGLEAEVDTR